MSDATLIALAEQQPRYHQAVLDAGVGERLLRSAAWLEGSRPEIDDALRRRWPGRLTRAGPRPRFRLGSGT